MGCAAIYCLSSLNQVYKSSEFLHQTYKIMENSLTISPSSLCHDEIRFHSSINTEAHAEGLSAYLESDKPKFRKNRLTNSVELRIWGSMHLHFFYFAMFCVFH